MDKQKKLLQLLNNYESLFDSTLGDWMLEILLSLA